ncbi:hypothetical protein [Muricoccus vinaceus]|uniref:DUF1173 domain-containing protein n=1 Tax=Muricoccus vinaceus TaxID=424704 RepID=A0ABV6IVI2_9PROT
MEIVDRTFNLRTVRRIRPAETMALKRVFGLRSNPLPGDQKLASDVVNELVGGDRRWLRCDCAGLESHPLLTAVMAQDGRTGLRRLTHGERDPHAPDCPFVRTLEEQAVVVRSFNRPRANTVFNLHPSWVEANDLVPSGDGEQTPISRRNAVVRDARPTLGTLLCALLHDAKINVISPKGYISGIERDVDALRRAASRFAINDLLKVSDVLRFGPDKVSDLPGEYRNLAWRGAGRPSLLYLTRMQGRTIDCLAIQESEEARWPIQDALRSSSRNVTLNSAPYSALVTYTETARSGDLGFGRGFAIPSYQRWTRFPLDSRLEGETLVTLRELQEEVKGSSMAFTIHKPLFNLPGEAGNNLNDRCIPDFQIELAARGAQPRRLFVETMGSSAPNYLERKRRSHEVMRRIAPVVCHMLKDLYSLKEGKPDFLRRESRRLKQRLRMALQCLPNHPPADPFEEF